jgi:YHS domain-containing protein
MNRLLYGICVMFVTIGVGGALTVRGQATTRAINHDKGVAIQGYDVVAYFTDNAAVKGNAQLVHTWNGVEWRFATAEHRDAFAKEPARYAPAFGGYCAYGVSRGYAVDIDPQAFAVVDGTLYLNYSRSVQRTWNEDRPGYIEKARQRWPEILAGLK